MNPTLAALLRELERLGEETDARESDRERRLLNITRDTGELLALLVRATRARRVLEIGTSNGYSTLWLADAVRDAGGHVTTIERSLAKAAMARANFARGGVEAVVGLVEEDAGRALATFAAASCDFVFLDSAREQYVAWWPQLARVLAPGALLVVDNALSHAEEMAPFVELLAGDPRVTTALVPVGKGELLVHRR